MQTPEILVNLNYSDRDLVVLNLGEESGRIYMFCIKKTRRLNYDALFIFTSFIISIIYIVLSRYTSVTFPDKSKLVVLN